MDSLETAAPQTLTQQSEELPDSSAHLNQTESTAQNQPTESPERPQKSEQLQQNQPPKHDGVRYEQRVFLTGATGSGKSYLARALFMSAGAPRLVVDPADSSLTAQAVGRTREEIAAATFHDPKRPPNLATARFVPRDPDDKDAYNAVFKWAFERFPRYVWIDEAGIVAPAAGYPKWVNTYCVQGLKRKLGLLSCHTRPREVCKNLIAQAAHLFVFNLPNPDDRKYIAEIAGIPPRVLDDAIAALAPHEFLWVNGTNRSITHCPAVGVQK